MINDDYLLIFTSIKQSQFKPPKNYTTDKGQFIDFWRTQYCCSMLPSQ